MMGNFYQCVVTLDGIDFKSSEHAYQWRLAKYVGRDDLAQCILESHTPGQAKEIASLLPRHLLGSCHSLSCIPCRKYCLQKQNAVKIFEMLYLKVATTNWSKRLDQIASGHASLHLPKPKQQILYTTLETIILDGFSNLSVPI